jgi:hypothetical protein
LENLSKAESLRIEKFKVGNWKETSDFLL